jgi:putative flippase GtrA
MRRFLRFGAVGGVVCAVDLGLVWLFSRWIIPTLAVSFAYLAAIAVHFCLNKFWVFENRDMMYMRQIWKYALTAAACWSCTVIVFSLALHGMTSQILIAKVIAIPPTTLLGYIMMRKFVFPAPRRDREMAAP